jgi:hypothetical protein
MQDSFDFPQKDIRIAKCSTVFTQDDENMDSVRWAPSGIGFIIVNEDTFSKTVLPKYFKHSNYSSFVRQVILQPFSSTCIIFTKSVKTAKKATFTMNTSMPRIAMHSRKSNVNPKKRKRKTMNQRNSIAIRNPSRKNSKRSSSLFSLTPKSTSQRKTTGMSPAPKRSSQKKSPKTCSNRRATVTECDCP